MLLSHSPAAAAVRPASATAARPHTEPASTNRRRPAAMSLPGVAAPVPSTGSLPLPTRTTAPSAEAPPAADRNRASRRLIPTAAGHRAPADAGTPPWTPDRPDSHPAARPTSYQRGL